MLAAGLLTVRGLGAFPCAAGPSRRPKGGNRRCTRAPVSFKDPKESKLGCPRAFPAKGLTPGLLPPAYPRRPRPLALGRRPACLPQTEDKPADAKPLSPGDILKGIQPTNGTKGSNGSGAKSATASAAAAEKEQVDLKAVLAAAKAAQAEYSTFTQEQVRARIAFYEPGWPAKRCSFPHMAHHRSYRPPNAQHPAPTELHCSLHPAPSCTAAVQVDKIFKAAALAANSARIPLAKMAVEETGMGVVEDKVRKELALGATGLGDLLQNHMLNCPAALAVLCLGYWCFACLIDCPAACLGLLGLGLTQLLASPRHPAGHQEPLRL